MKIEAIPMRTVTYFGTKIQIPAHHTAIAVDASGMVHSFEAAPKLDVNVLMVIYGVMMILICECCQTALSTLLKRRQKHTPKHFYHSPKPPIEQIF